MSRSIAARNSDLKVRATTGAIAIVVAVAALWLGGVAFWALASVAALAMIAEWGGLAHATPARRGIAIAALAVPLAFACPAGWGPTRDVVAILGVAAIIVALGLGGVRLGAGVLFAGLPTIGLLFLRDLPNGLMLTLWTLAIVWATDIGAFFAGRRIGGPKLSPRISPNKTWAGLAGGMAGALVVGFAIVRLAGLPDALAFLGAPLAVVAQAGDLFESWLKRRAGVKDSGRLLPGHGGALDRLDGVVPVATLVAALIAGGMI